MDIHDTVDPSEVFIGVHVVICELFSCCHLLDPDIIKPYWELGVGSKLHFSSI